MRQITKPTKIIYKIFDLIIEWFHQRGISILSISMQDIDAEI